MAFACQRDSYMREFSSTVKSCEAAQLSTVVNGKKQKLSGYDVILDDTILFPEGGGQPDDRGKINDVEVLRVMRRGADAVHFLPVPLDVGTEVKMEVDWVRRWDNMQQHSGQHLITAIADSLFGFATTSWSLGERVSTIELDTPAMSQHQVAALEAEVNQKVRAGLRMYPALYDSLEDPALGAFRSRGLPDDHVGPIRVVTIETIEDDLCCGTHVSNISHLQCIKLLDVEKGKKGKVNLSFVAGDRLLGYLSKCHDKERKLTAMLKGGPDQHVELLDKMQKSLKVAQKNATVLVREVAALEAKAFKDNPDRGNFLSLHKREGDHDYMNIIINDIADENVLIFLTTGDERGAGMFMLAGKEEELSVLGPKVAAMLEGKGAGKRGRFQGKATRLSRRAEAEKLLRGHLAGGTVVPGGDS